MARAKSVIAAIVDQSIAGPFLAPLDAKPFDVDPAILAIVPGNEHSAWDAGAEPLDSAA